jgi:hypothetical protein
MKTPIINGPSRACLVALALLAGCGEEEDSAEAKAADPIISVAVSAAAPLANIQSLTLEFSPSHIYAPCDGPGNYTGNYHCHPSNIRVFTDQEGVNRFIAPVDESKCYMETYTVPAPSDRDEYRAWLEAGGEVRQRRVCPDSGTAHSFLTLINTLESNPLPVSYIARDNRLDAGTFNRIIVQAWGLPGRDDSYADLSDGRRCEVNVIFPNDLDPLDQEHYLDFMFPEFTVKNGEEWRIDLQLDFSSTVIDPAQCAEGLDLYVTPGAATIERTKG